MITKLTDYITPFTPYLSRVHCTGKRAGLEGMGKAGFGPSFGSPEEKEQAIAAENELISSYIDSWIRGELFRHCMQFGFAPLGNCDCTLIPKSAEKYPVRVDDDRNPVNPMLVKENRVALNPAWENAGRELTFGFNQDVLKLDGHVSRVLQTDRFLFKIELALTIPQGSVCAQLFPRV